MENKLTHCNTKKEIHENELGSKPIINKHFHFIYLLAGNQTKKEFFFSLCHPSGTHEWV